MKLFAKKTQQVPASYRPVLEATEVLDLFTRMTLHQQCALLRLLSRNLLIESQGDVLMGYDFEYNVEGAMIVARDVDGVIEA